MDVRSEYLFAHLSATVSAGDGIVYDYVGPQPAGLQLSPTGFGVGGAGVSQPMMTMATFIRRCLTNVQSVSNVLSNGDSAAAIEVGFGASPSGIQGMLQGVPFRLSAAAALSGSVTSQISTTSNQIRKVLVTLTMSALPLTSGAFALAGGGIGFVYGSAMTTGAQSCLSGTLAYSYFDYVALPLPSANEVPLGWINVVNSTLTSGQVPASCIITDYRATQGMNLSALLQSMQQP